MSNVISYQDGDVCKLIIPTPVNENRLDDLAKELLPAGTVYKIIDTVSIPQNRIFRNAWILGVNEVLIDHPKAETLHLNRLKILRDKQLKQLDMEYLKALEIKDAIEQTRVANLKNQLRTMPETVDLASIPIDQLASYKPMYLEGNIEELGQVVAKTLVAGLLTN